MFERYVLIMVGGSGERFWPLSTPEKPKQFLRLASPTQTLFQQCVQRNSAMVGQEHLYVGTAPHLVQNVLEDWPSLSAKHVLAEPFKRNTAGCLVWACAHWLASSETDPAKMSFGVVPADHRIHPQEAYQRVIQTAFEVAEQTGGLVTLGIKPTRPETGFGYIEADTSSLCNEVGLASTYKAKSFREKPDLETARQFLEAGRFFWNSGMFFWTFQSFLNELQAASPELYGACQEIARALKFSDQQSAQCLFESIANISIDYALMEKSSNVYVVEAAFEWDDLGSWDALSRSLPLDDSGNAIQGKAHLVDSSNCIVYNEGQAVEVCLLGTEDLIVVQANGRILVCPKHKVQDVRKVKRT